MFVPFDVVGAMGQLGGELIRVLRAKYGNDNVVASDIRVPRNHILSEGGSACASVFTWVWWCSVATRVFDNTLSNTCFLLLSLSKTAIYTHTHIYIYISVSVRAHVAV